MADSVPPAGGRGPDEWGALLARRRWLIGGTLVVVWALACGLAFWLPPRYQSQATLLIRRPQVAAAVVGGAASADNNELEHITQQVLSQPRLAALAGRLGVLEPPAHSPEQAAARMLAAVQLDWVAAPGQRPGDGPAALTVAFTARSAELAQAVNQQLVRWLVATNQQTRQARAAGAASFLAQALAASAATLATRQQALRAFQAQHPNLDPVEAASDAQRLVALEAERSAAQQELSQAQQQQLYLTSLTAEYRGLLNEPASGAAAGAGTALDQRIGLLESELSALRARYTDQYPEVRRLQAELAAAQRERRSGTPSSASGATTPAQVAAMAPLLQVESQARANRMALRHRRQQLTALGDQIAALQAVQNAAPALQPQLQSLQQAVAEAQSQYNALAAEQHQAGLAVALQRGPQGAQFRILNPPTLPARPDFPDKLLFSGLGLAAGLGLGLVLALVREWGDDRLHSAAEIQEWALAPLVGAVPVLATEPELRRAARRRGWQWALVSVLVLVVASSNWWLVLHP